MGTRAIFFSGNRQEVNSTWYPQIEEPIKSREKHYSLVLYILHYYINILRLHFLTRPACVVDWVKDILPIPRDAPLPNGLGWFIHENIN